MINSHEKQRKGTGAGGVRGKDFLLGPRTYIPPFKKTQGNQRAPNFLPCIQLPVIFVFHTHIFFLPLNIDTMKVIKAAGSHLASLRCACNFPFCYPSIELRLLQFNTRPTP